MVAQAHRTPALKRLPSITCSHPRARPAVRLFCFPYAGVGASVYHPWHNLLPPQIEVLCVQLPGREARLREAPYRHITDVVEAVQMDIEPLLDRPFAFFGHSLGALVAFGLARRLCRQSGHVPVHLFFSSRRAPHLPDPFPPTGELSDEEFIVAIQHRYNGIPRAILQNSELLALLLPALRADFAVLESYVYEDGMPFDCPVSVFGGEQDTSISYSELAAWRHYTRGEFSHLMFPGDHFYIQGQRDALVQRIAHLLLAQIVPGDGV